MGGDDLLLGAGSGERRMWGYVGTVDLRCGLHFRRYLNRTAPAVLTSYNGTRRAWDAASADRMRGDCAAELPEWVGWKSSWPRTSGLNPSSAPLRSCPCSFFIDLQDFSH